MPLLLCPNDNSTMQTVQRSGVEFDICPTCRGVWLDRGELEKLLDAANQEAHRGQTSTTHYQSPPASHYAQRSERRDWDDDDHRYRKRRRPSIFDIFD